MIKESPSPFAHSADLEIPKLDSRLPGEALASSYAAWLRIQPLMHDCKIMRSKLSADLM